MTMIHFEHELVVEAKRCDGVVPRVFLRPHSRRCLVLKTSISVVFVSSLIVSWAFMMHIALAANLIWLWVDMD